MADMEEVLPPKLINALDQFKRDADDYCKSVITALNAKKPPKRLFHYTDDAGLKGILGSGKIWMTDIFKLNDPSELQYGLAIGAKELEVAARCGPPELKQFSTDFKKHFVRHLEKVAHFFVCSFSRNGDELGQWRAYADDGRGYAIGFEGAELEGRFTTDSVGGSNATFWVNYSKAQLVRHHRELVNLFSPHVSAPHGLHSGNESLRSFMGDLLGYLSLYAIVVSLFHKHQAYGAEAEYRFLRLWASGERMPDVKTRRRQYTVIPYVEFAWARSDRTPLARINIGPAADFEKSRKFVDDLLRMYNLAGKVEVRPSDIPYRSALRL